MTIDANELLPCPHCGKSSFARVKPYPWEKEGEEDLVWGHHVICDASGLDIWQRGCGSTSGWGETKAEAIAAWNRRTQPSAGEVVAWHWWATDQSSTWPVWVMQKERPKRAPPDAIALYATPPVSKLVERLETLPRWKPQQGGVFEYGDQPFAYMAKSGDGEWVRFSDVRQALHGDLPLEPTPNAGEERTT